MDESVLTTLLAVLLLAAVLYDASGFCLFGAAVILLSDKAPKLGAYH